MNSHNERMSEQVELCSEHSPTTSGDEKETSKNNNNKRRLPISSTSSSSSPLTKRIHQPLETHMNQSSGKHDEDPLTVEQHRALVHAIYENGLAESSPLLIWEHMSEKIKAAYPELNIEKLKSKLQKYRKNKDKYEEEFMSEYDTTLKELMEPKSGGKGHTSSSGGPDIANLTHSIMTQKDANDDTPNSILHSFPFLSKEKSQDELQGGSLKPSVSAPILDNDNQDCSIMALPVLTSAEKNSAIGQSFEFFLALFESLKCELYAQREQQRLNTQNGNHHFSRHDNVKQVVEDAHHDEMPSLNPREHNIHHGGSLTPIPSDYIHITNDQKQHQPHTSGNSNLFQQVPGIVSLKHIYENGNTEKEATNIDMDRIKNERE